MSVYESLWQPVIMFAKITGKSWFCEENFTLGFKTTLIWNSVSVANCSIVEEPNTVVIINDYRFWTSECLTVWYAVPPFFCNRSILFEENRAIVIITSKRYVHMWNAFFQLKIERQRRNGEYLVSTRYYSVYYQPRRHFAFRCGNAAS